MKNNVDRRERERKEARLRIVEAARELFASGGEEALTLRRVADMVEYSATTIYLHFRNKDALIRELCVADFAAFSRKFVLAERSSDPVDRLRKVAAGYVDFGLQFPGHYRAMFVTIGDAEPSRTPDAKDNAALSPATGRSAISEVTGAKNSPKPQDFLQAAVFKGLAAGIFKDEYRDVPLLTQTLWAGLHGLVSLYQVRAKHPAVPWRPIQTLAETMIECLLNGVILPSLAIDATWRRPA